MRVALINGTGNASLDGGYVCWSPDTGTFSMESTGQPVSESQVRALLERGYAVPLVSGGIPTEPAATSLDSPAESELLAVAATAGERFFAERRREERKRVRRQKADALRPYFRIAGLAAGLALAFLGWRLYLAAPEAWRSSLESGLLGLLRHYVL